MGSAQLAKHTNSFKFHNVWHTKITRKIITENSVSLPCSYSLSRRVRALFFPQRRRRFLLLFSLTHHLLPQIPPVSPRISNTLQLVSEPVVFGFNNMTPETRSQDARRIDDSLEAINQRIDGIEVKLQFQSDDLAQLKVMMKEMLTQQIVIKQALQTLTGGVSSSQNTPTTQLLTPANNSEGMGEGSHSTDKSCQPRRDLPTFEGEEVHKGLYKYNQYFDLEEVPESDKLKLASESYITTFALSYEGKFGEIYSANERWEHKKQYPGDECDIYGTCGPFGFCNTQSLLICRCLPRLPKPIFWFCGKKKKKKNLVVDRSNLGGDRRVWLEVPSFHLEDKVDVMEGVLSRTKGDEEGEGNERQAEA